MESEKRACNVSARTTFALKEEIRAEAGRRRWSESELVHMILSLHFGRHPDTGEPTDPGGSALGMEAQEESVAAS